MTDIQIIHLGIQAMTLGAKLAGPILIVTLVVGLVMSLIQTVFSLQDQSLGQVPRLVIGAVTLLIAGSWMLHTTTDFMTTLWGQIPDLVGG